MIFHRDHLIQGYQGGRIAAQKLTQSIAEQLSNEEVHVYGRLSFWITVYFNRSELAESLATNNICSPEQFQAFLSVWFTHVFVIGNAETDCEQGFTQASPRFSTVDVGQGKDALEAKIKGDWRVTTCVN